MTRKIITDEKFVEALKNNPTIKAALYSLGMATSGGNYDTARRIAIKYDVDVKCKKPGKSNWKREPIEKILVENSNYGCWRLKNRLIEEGFLEYKCDECGINKWNDKPLSLHMDHINGIRNDNRLENLRLLCPNCHSQTETYCGRANKIYNKTCVDCGKKVYKKSTRCRKCEALSRLGKKTKANWPPLEELIEMVKNSSYVAVGKELGVSGNAVKKHIVKRKAI